MSDKPDGPDADPCPSPAGGLPSRAVVDLDAIRDNVAALAGHAGSAEVMAVVKADAYGHGLVPSARAAARAAARPGSAWPSSAEALALRAAGVDRPAAVLAARARRATSPRRVAADIDLSVSAPWALDEIAAAARELGRTARVHLKVDTGLGRNGALGDDWPDLRRRGPPAEAEGAVEVVGVWSHFAYADAPDHPTVRPQQERFVEAVALAERAGCDPEVRHLANSAATLTNPGAALRPGPARARRLRALAGARPRRPRRVRAARRR